MNRTEKRQHFATARRSEDSIFCPVCKHKTMHIAMPHEDTCDIYCSVCYNRLAQGITPGTNGVMPKQIVKGHMWKQSFEKRHSKGD